MAASPLAPGQRLELYRLEAVLGESMGEVWSAWAPDQLRVLIKTSAYAFAAYPEILARFESKSLHLRSLRHPNIVRHLDALGWEDRPFPMLGHLSGGSLADRIATYGPQLLAVMLA